MPFHLGPGELIIILVIILIVFGVGRLPEVGGALGRGLREFRKGQAGVEEASKQVESRQETTEKEKKD